MAFAKRAPFSATLALSRVDRLIGRILSLFMLVSLVECISVFITQFKYLEPTWALVSLTVYAAALFFNIFNFWFLGGQSYGYVIHGVVVALLVATWQFQLSAEVTGVPHFQPWIWWATGGASMAMGLLLPRWWAWAYMAAVPAVWFVLLQTPLGGEADLAKAAQDASFVTLFPAALVTLTHLLRNSARNVDEATDKAAQASAERARIDAIERERSRVDALVHDSVLTTLIVSARAQSKSEKEAALDLAQKAIDKLKAAADDNLIGTISVLSFSQALTQAIERQEPGIDISFSGASGKTLPIEVASALTDATTQAVANSIQHAGRSATRLVRIKATKKELKIVVSDNGIGFRVARIAKNRLGLRLSIIQRVENIGGRVFINTQPGSGTAIILEWDFK
jgi:signal transduction histidine kinase